MTLGCVITNFIITPKCKYEVREEHFNKLMVNQQQKTQLIDSLLFSLLFQVVC